MEKVRFPVDSPRHREPGVLGFGAAAPLVHPASGFSVATALALAPAVADAVARRLPAGPDAALAAARAVVWPRGRADGAPVPAGRAGGAAADAAR